MRVSWFVEMDTRRGLTRPVGHIMEVVGKVELARMTLIVSCNRRFK